MACGKLRLPDASWVSLAIVDLIYVSILTLLFRMKNDKGELDEVMGIAGMTFAFPYPRV